MLDNIFFLLEIISGVSCFMISLFLFSFTVPDTLIGRRNKRACLFIEISAFLMGCISLGFILMGGEHHRRMVAFFIQGFAPLQILLLMLALAYPIYIGNNFKRFMRKHIVYTCLLCIGNMVYFWLLNGQIGSWIYNLLLAFFSFLFIFYIRTYLRISKRWEEHYPECKKYFRKKAYPLCFLLAIVGLYAVIANILPTHRNQLIFISIYTLAYIYFALQYNKYGLTISHYIKADNIKEEVINVSISPFSKWLSSKEENRKRQNYEVIKKKLEIWETQKTYLHPKLTIQKVSQEIGVNQTYLSNFINDCYQTNFNRWINSLRIDEAKEIMLHKPDIGLAEIAELVGFADLAHFSKQFKLKEGTSPSAWRKQNNLK
ncbi:transcriptional regulator, AraC family [Phocaeicola plebeius DSM 17135]|uniref:Transcriptional regulator, AraC family n=1 Tax=Phocaeicola plebeius (strain DSM 17135 / JCM 12973 / CCUG 54634 / M2) TaxID=484018 RepID=B5CTK4_PHOPM|nr:helix-turn-helix domain-containing protein [Phocaeicola plebeius]EDY97292.1 transcriptional regulator, AraC family [Phocaeicola plebeius DSM 17135]